MLLPNLFSGIDATCAKIFVLDIHISKILEIIEFIEIHKFINREISRKVEKSRFFGKKTNSGPGGQKPEKPEISRNFPKKGKKVDFSRFPESGNSGFRGAENRRFSSDFFRHFVWPGVFFDQKT